MVRVQLPGEEQAEDDQTDRDTDEHPVGVPARRRRLDDAPQQHGEADGGEEGTDEVEAGRGGIGGVGHQQGCGDHPDDDHRHVDEEHRAPPEVLEQQAAGDGTHGDADACYTGPYPDGLLPLVGLDEDVGEDRERRRHDQRSPHAHEPAAEDEMAGRAGQRRQHGPDAEDDDPDAQRPLAAEPIAQAAGREQQPREHQCVAVDDPLQLAEGRVQVPDEGREGDVQDRVVQPDHGQAHAQHGQDPPPPPGRMGPVQGEGCERALESDGAGHGGRPFPANTKRA